MYRKWVILEDQMASNIQTVESSDLSIINSVAGVVSQLHSHAVVIFGQIVGECVTRSKGAVPCQKLMVAGNQAVLLQRMSRFAVLQGLNLDVEGNRKIMMEDVEEFESAQYSLVHGKSPNISRTEDHCTLQQIKVVQDAWSTFRSTVDKVNEGATDGDTLLLLDKAQWNAGVDPMFDKVSKVVVAVSKGHGVCTQVGKNNATREELEEAIKQVGNLGSLAHRFAKERFFEKKGGNPNITDVSEFEVPLRHLISGWKYSTLPAPPSASVASSLYNILGDDETGWQSYLAKLQSDTATDRELNDMASEVATFTRTAVDVYVKSAADINPDVPGARSSQVSAQTARFEEILKETFYMSLTGNARGAYVGRLIEDFEKEHESLQNGLDSRRLQETNVEASERDHFEVMAAVWQQWSALKPVINRVLAGEANSLEALQNISSYASSVETSLNQTTKLFSTMTQTTTKTQVNIMMPLPISGHWAPGLTMKIAAMIAEDIINRQQILLPGYRIVADFFDDECDADRSNRAMLEKFASSQDWVGVGGLGCLGVCKSLSVIAASLFLPIVSFECSDGDELSNSELYPDFIRLGTRRSGLVAILADLKERAAWTDLVIVASTEVDATGVAGGLELQMKEEALFPNLVRHDVSLEWEQGTSDWSGIDAAMNAIKAAKQRVIFVIGAEAQFRRVICSSHRRDIFPGLTWLSEGVKSRSWWTQPDSELVEQPASAECTPDTLSELYQMGLNVVGRAQPTAEHEDDELDCFPGWTSGSLNAYIKSSLAEGYPASVPLENRTTVPYPHDDLINLAVDGMCMFATTVQRMLASGHTIEELRTPVEGTYESAVTYMKNQLKFVGASGEVNIEQNDLPRRLAIHQAIGNESITVGIVEATPDSDDEKAYTITWGRIAVNDAGEEVQDTSGTLNNESWKPAPADAPPPEDEPFPALVVVIPVLIAFFCAIVCYAMYSSRASAKGAGNKV